ncbi:LexA family protein [Modicisalibacter xianhensis]|uniref:SOS response UmuD protein. Serine peptidase. MEROPS family S24 n=1 Tax=Modicisalibacter xianhensis TaxID=442341 RepID=A0A1I3FQX6_9GAMM|nr:translesion error-prone DNA polymerase V autoproteolytic subunit [Halomonas xianhensis]SFI13678.1 SOS response UmuD protein. Serine peptidase. MEROPS family S24 [Halomonas xianhensis]
MLNTPRSGEAASGNGQLGGHIAILGQSSVSSRYPLPLMAGEVRAGFPIHAEAEVDRILDLTEHLIPRPSASYFCRAKGDSMEGCGIYDGDLLIVDRSLEPMDGDVIVVCLDGELTCKQLGKWHGQPALLSGNPAYHPIALNGTDCETWGVVIHNVHSHRRRGL